MVRKSANGNAGSLQTFGGARPFQLWDMVRACAIGARINGSSDTAAVGGSAEMADGKT